MLGASPEWGLLVFWICQGGAIDSWEGGNDVEERMATAAEVPGPGMYPRPKSFDLEVTGNDSLSQCRGSSISNAFSVVRLVCEYRVVPSASPRSKTCLQRSRTTSGSCLGPACTRRSP